jgi:hypothetical protein
MRAQPHPIGIGDTDAGRDHVVRHSRDLVDASDFEQATRGAHLPSDMIDFARQARADRCPCDVGQDREHPGQINAARRNQTVAEQMQAQIDVVGIDGRLAERADRGADGADAYLPPGIRLQTWYRILAKFGARLIG